MWSKFTVDDARTIGHYLGLLIAFSAAIYIPSLVTGLCYREWEPIARYLFAAGINLVIGLALCFLRVQPTRLTQQQAIVVTGLAWLVLAVFASIPLFLSGHYNSYVDALFDGVSGFTTTGACLVQDLDHLSYADNMFRFMMILVGGLGLIVVALSLGLFGKGGAASLYSSEARSEHVVPNVVQTARFIARVALFFIVASTFVLAIICLISGVAFTRAILHGFWLAITSFMTGGFAPTSQSAMYYHSLPMEIALMLLMLFGSLNFVMHDNIWKGNLLTFFRDIETRTMCVWLVAITVVFAAALCASTEYSSVFDMMRRGLFTVIAAFSTTGLQNITTNQLTTVFSSGAFLTVALIMAVGGGAGGTAGGMKLYRVGIVFKSVAASVKEALSPSSARVVITYYHVGRRQLSPETSREALTVFLLFVITYTLGTLAGVAHGYEAPQAIFESVAMASNGGLTSGVVAAGMPVDLEMFYILEMWAGRLEFITLIALVVSVFVSMKPSFIKRGR